MFIRNFISNILLIMSDLVNFVKPTGHVMHQQFNIATTVRSAHTVFMCFVII